MVAVFAATLVTALVLAVPHGWHTIKSNPKLRGSCDPVTLMVVGSAPIGIASRSGGWLPPKRGQVLVTVLEDHAVRPVGDLRRPRHFAIDWQTTREITPCCGSPNGPASMHWFRQAGRYLGFIVYIGRDVPTARRVATEHMLDSLRLA